jgi:hypothetical protein
MTRKLSLSQTIEYAESVVGPELEKELTDYLQLARDTTDLSGELINRVELATGNPRAIHVATRVAGANRHRSPGGLPLASARLR